MNAVNARNGNGNDSYNNVFKQMYEMQVENQKSLIDAGSYDHFAKTDREKLYNLPCDSTELMSYHVQQLMSEIGELLEADKRWKNFRNAKYDRDGKLMELADCFIVLMNIAMFSGFDCDELSCAIISKLYVVNDRIYNVTHSNLGNRS